MRASPSQRTPHCHPPQPGALARHLGICLLTVLLAGCLGGNAAVAPPAWYLLPETGLTTMEGTTRSEGNPANKAGSTEAVEASNQWRLLVHPPQLAGYLEGDGIVLQLDDIRLNQAQRHRWAEPLGRQLQFSLRRQLAVALPAARVANSAVKPQDGARFDLYLEVDRFQGDHLGNASCSGRWRLRNPEGALIAEEEFSARSPMQGDGYPELVRALGRCWSQVGGSLAMRLRELPLRPREV